MRAAAAAAAAVGAGVFLWSKRSQISEQLSNLSDQISDWTESMRSNEQGSEFASADDRSKAGVHADRTGKTQQEISEEALDPQGNRRRLARWKPSGN